MIKVKDQLNNEIELANPAKRIISLVPSQTELLHFFGLDDEVVGITKFCIHPERWFQSKTRVGGTKKLDLDKIRNLRPDLIIANKEENTQEEIELLQKEFVVYISDIITFEQAYDMIESVGRLCGKEQLAVDLIDEIQESFDSYVPKHKKVVYLIWKDPYMCVGTGNYINSVFDIAGYQNVIQQPRYVEISEDEIIRMKPDVIFLSTEPYPFKKEHVQQLRERTGIPVKIVDGEMFSWYGSRMKDLRNYLDSLD